MRRFKFILPFAIAALSLAVVAAASARPEQDGVCGEAHEDQLQGADEDRLRVAGDGRRRLPRHRTADVGEAGGQADRAERSA